MSRIASCVAAALLLLGGCNRRPPDDPNAAPVAWVNGQTISRAEFERELARSLELPDGTSAPTPDQLAALRQTVLQARVDRWARPRITRRSTGRNFAGPNRQTIFSH